MSEREGRQEKTGWKGVRWRSEKKYEGKSENNGGNEGGRCSLTSERSQNLF